MEISVIIPTYKPQAYLWKCLESLAAQTLPKDKFEIMLVLNGCSDPYRTQIKTYIKSTNINIKFIQTDVKGVSNARNIGLDNARGEYIAFIDDDDYISPSYLEKLYNVGVKCSGAIVASNVLTYDDRTGYLDKDYIGRAFDLYTSRPTNSIFKKRKFLSSCCCKLIPKYIIGDKRFYINHRVGEDALFMFAISDRIECIELAPDECVYYRRLTPNSVTRKKSSLSIILSNRLSLIISYFTIYFPNIFQYNFALFLSRIVSVIVKIK